MFSVGDPKGPRVLEEERERCDFSVCYSTDMVSGNVVYASCPAILITCTSRHRASHVQEIGGWGQQGHGEPLELLQR